MVEKKEALKKLIEQLRAGLSQENAKKRFKEVLKDATPLEISQIEQELIDDGMQREEIQRLCDVHLAVFREQPQEQKLILPSGHLITILMEEHKIMLQLADELTAIVPRMQKVEDFDSTSHEQRRLQHISRVFRDSDKHYLREENVLFPLLEKHGITEPPAVMWKEHDEIRERKKKLTKLIDDHKALGIENLTNQLAEDASALHKLLSNHFYKENNILFPTAARTITENEWRQAKKDFEEIGYCTFTPPIQTDHTDEEGTEPTIQPKGILQFETGSLSAEEINSILNSLPIDISFVDRDNRVKYFSKPEGRIFIRTKSVLGREVQLCHPQKSVHIVTSILEAFKTGKKDKAEFWINLNDRLIHIRYFAIRAGSGEYLGTLEVTQDLTELKAIEGERRLLDWTT